jgi:hypothetical protein
MLLYTSDVILVGTVQSTQQSYSPARNPGASHNTLPGFGRALGRRVDVPHVLDTWNDPAEVRRKCHMQKSIHDLYTCTFLNIIYLHDLQVDILKYHQNDKNNKRNHNVPENPSTCATLPLHNRQCTHPLTPCNTSLQGLVAPAKEPFA